MRILLINPPNCGRSIPEERYGITSLKQIFRGEPLALEELAGSLAGHEVEILDLKVEPEALEDTLARFRPRVAGITGVTCEANTMLRIAARVKAVCGATVVVGGVHASNDPAFFNHQAVDFIVTGLGRRRLAALIRALEQGVAPAVAGVLTTAPGHALAHAPVRDRLDELDHAHPPAYHLTSRYRSHYILEKLGLNMGFVASAYGCPHRCSFCAIRGQTGGAYLARPIETVLRDIALLGDIPVIRLVDANTFGDVARARELGLALAQSGLKKNYLADIRSDTVVAQPDMLRQWKAAGLRAVIIGFEEIDDASLAAMNKANRASVNTEAIAVLHELGITIVGDFIISPDYGEEDFARLAAYLATQRIDLPMITVMTPLPGTPLYQQQRGRIVNHDLDYYTLTNAVLPTRLPEERFYTLYAQLLAEGHHHAKL